MKMDVRAGYNNVRITKGHEWLAAFITKYGLFEPLVMFFGLCNSPTTFQHMMDNLFVHQLTNGWLLIYMDDMLIATDDDTVIHINCICESLQILHNNDLFIKPSKCDSMVQKVEFLGFIIKNGTVSMDPIKVKGIVEWPAPQNLQQLHSFLGFCNFYHRFVYHYADLARPLNELLQKATTWFWTTKRDNAFANLKLCFTKDPVLLIPDSVKPFEIKADASLFATGAVLYQNDINDVRHPCAFISQSLSPAERNYQIYDREFLSIIRALCTWHHYIQGSPFLTVVFNDHQNLTYFRTAQRLNPRQAQWSLKLAEYDILLKYVLGPKMVAADALSH